MCVCYIASPKDSTFYPLVATDGHLGFHMRLLYSPFQYHHFMWTYNIIIQCHVILCYIQVIPLSLEIYSYSCFVIVLFSIAVDVVRLISLTILVPPGNPSVSHQPSESNRNIDQTV